MARFAEDLSSGPYVSIRRNSAPVAGRRLLQARRKCAYGGLNMNRNAQLLLVVLVVAGALVAVWRLRSPDKPNRSEEGPASRSSSPISTSSTIGSGSSSSRGIRLVRLPSSEAGPGQTAAADAHCKGNNGGASCTPTELLFLQKDTDLATGEAKNGKAFGCYDCLVASGCLDDKQDPTDVHHECGDVAASGVGRPTLSGGSPTEACLSVLSCVLSSGCGGAGGVGACFCGTAVGEKCLTSPNGPCQSEIEDALGTTDPAVANQRFTNTAYGAGMASTILACAGSNTCSQCYP
jgi:hypothetical protein